MAKTDLHATEMFYENIRRISDMGGNGFPRFSKKTCGGGNRNGEVFRHYHDGKTLLRAASEVYARKPRSQTHLLREVEGARQEMAAEAAERGRKMHAMSRFHPLTVPAAPDVARGSKPYRGQPIQGRKTGNIALGTKLPPADFKPFRAFSPQKQRRSRRLDPVAAPLYERLAEPIMRPDLYKMEQFVPLMRTW